MINFLKELAVFGDITFKESTHSYSINGSPANDLSVTRLVKSFKKPFEKEQNANRVAKRRKCSTEQVLAEWDLKGLYSTTLGSMLHKYIENFYANKRLEFDGEFSGLGPNEKAEIKQNLPILISYFHRFYLDNKHILCAKSELVLGDIQDTKICGMSDLLGFNTQTEKFEILDFKTNKKMEKRSKWASRLYAPFDDMFEGEINEYTIQLNCYKYFIEKYTSLEIDKLKLVWLNPINDDYKVIELDDVQPQIKLAFEQFTSTF